MKFPATIEGRFLEMVANGGYTVVFSYSVLG